MFIHSFQCSFINSFFGLFTPSVVHSTDIAEQCYLPNTVLPTGRQLPWTHILLGRQTINEVKQQMWEIISGQDRCYGGKKRADVTTVARVVKEGPRVGDTGHLTLTETCLHGFLTFTLHTALLSCVLPSGEGSCLLEGQTGVLKGREKGAARDVPTRQGECRT